MIPKVRKDTVAFFERLQRHNMSQSDRAGALDAMLKKWKVSKEKRISTIEMLEQKGTLPKTKGQLRISDY